MKKYLSAVLACLLLMQLSGCGVKGSLYYPENQTSNNQIN